MSGASAATALIALVATRGQRDIYLPSCALMTARCAGANVRYCGLSRASLMTVAIVPQSSMSESRRAAGSTCPEKCARTRWRISDRYCRSLKSCELCSLRGT
eukprot:7387071-Prymnesium_polylepis.1